MDEDVATATPSRPLARHRQHLSPGRPHRLHLRLSDQEKTLVEEAARAAGLTPSGFAAQAVVAAAQVDSPVTGPGGDLRELQRELFAARRAVNMLGANLNQAAAAYNGTGELPERIADAVRLCTAAVGRLDEVTARIDRRLR